jgi:mono/diheme cytochrome c family protein
MLVRIVLVVAASFARAGEPVAADEALARGKYLVTVTGCNDCHTPLEMTPEGPRPDMDRMLSGHPETLVMPTAPALPEGPWQTRLRPPTPRGPVPGSRICGPFPS